MRYLTREWASGGLSDEDYEAAWAAYRAHLDALMPHLPASLLRLARTVSLHDALIRRIVVDSVGGQITVALLCGNPQVGYAGVDLTYSGVDSSAVDLAALAAAARDPQTELWYDESDSGEGGTWVHRMLFYPECETPIGFSGFHLALATRSDRTLAPLADRYTEV